MPKGELRENPPQYKTLNLATNDTDTKKAGKGDPLKSSAAPHQGIQKSLPQHAGVSELRPPVASFTLSGRIRYCRWSCRK